MWLKSQGKNEKKDTDTIMNNKTWHKFCLLYSTVKMWIPMCYISVCSCHF
jgi:hypothetical protein